MDTILYFTKTDREVQYFLEKLSEQLHIYGIPCTINYRNATVETENYKLYAASSCCSCIGAFPGFRYYLNDSTQEEFNKSIRLKLLENAKVLTSFENLVELLRMPVF